MRLVKTWTGRHADRLRQALRMSNESFASHLGVAVRTVAYWRARPDVVPKPAVQEMLDVAFERAPDRVKAYFATLVEEDYKSESLLTLDDKKRINGVIQKPSRLDVATIDSLSQVLAGQRHAEDVLGPEAIIAPMTVQLESISRVLKNAYGPHREAFARLVAEWTTFVGWLHTAVGEHDKARALFVSAEDLADDIGDGVIAATATSFRGYLARLHGQPKSTIRASAAALASPGSHPAQHTYDLLQTAQAYATLGDYSEASRFLDKASTLASNAGEPPASVYWYTEPFFRLNIGLTQLAIGRYRDAVDSLTNGIENIPADQQGAEWLTEYRQALAHARERA